MNAQPTASASESEDTPAVPNRDDWFEMREGFPRPDWRAIEGWIRALAGSKDDLHACWQQAARHWLERVRSVLGDSYRILESQNFHFLSDLDPEAGSSQLSFMEWARTRILQAVGSTRHDEVYGKHAVLRFSNEEAYTQYVADFHADGIYAGSGGMFLNGGYTHVVHPAYPGFREGERHTLVHELTHNLLCHLPLPPWLNEALAMAFEADLGGSRPEPLTRERVRGHREYWNAATIQRFWRGWLFSDVKGQTYAYELARILLNLIHSEVRPPQTAFRRFVLRSDWRDAGALAAREHLGVELEEIATCFLGQGEWSPKPELWQDEGVTSEDFETNDEPPEEKEVEATER